jgi:hypothetical protein
MNKIKEINNDDYIINKIDLSKKIKFLQEINSYATLHKRKCRIVHNANIDKPKITIYYYGQYKYFDKNKNRDCFITEKIPNVTGKRHYDDETIIRAVKPVLENEMTISYAASYAREYYNLTTVPSTIWHWLGAIEIADKTKNEIERNTKLDFSGHIGIDEVYDNKDGIIFITDLVKDLIIKHKTCEGKPNNEIIKNELDSFKKAGFDPKTCTKDGSPLYINTISDIFNNILLQICIFHLIKNMLKYFLDWHREIRGELNIKKLPHGLKCSGKHLKQFLFRTRTLFVKKVLKEEEKIILKKIINGFPKLSRLRKKFVQFLSIFDSDNLNDAERRYWLFISDPIVNEKMPDLIKQLKKHYDNNELFTYLLFDKSLKTKIRTTNQTERTNRKFRKKQKTHYRIRNKERREKLLKLMYYFHNYKSLKMKSEFKLIVIKIKNVIMFIIFSDYEFFSFFLLFLI